MASLLPPSSTAAERAIDAATSRIGKVPVPIRDLWDADTCPLALLPWLAWAVGTIVWDPNWGEAIKRAAVKASLALHGNLGTRGAVLSVLAQLGHTPTQLIEGIAAYRLDGSWQLDGAVQLDQTNMWALYRLVYDLGALAPLAAEDVADLVAKLELVAPLRSQLAGIGYIESDTDNVGVSDYCAATITALRFLDGTWLLDGVAQLNGVAAATAGAWA